MEPTEKPAPGGSTGSTSGTVPTRTRSARPRTTAQDTLADGAHTLSLVGEYAADLRKADEKQKRKVADDKTVAGWQNDLDHARQMVAEHEVARTTAQTATLTEERRRASLYDLLAELRGELTMRLPEQHDGVARSFGAHGELRPDSTPELLHSASVMLTAWARLDLQGPAVEAGVTAQQMHAVDLARGALSAADTAQKTAQSHAVGQGAVKRAALRKVRRNCSRIRQIARVVFRKRPDVIERFKSKVARRTPTVRAAK